MDTYLEDIILPEFIPYDAKDSLEQSIVTLREVLYDDNILVHSFNRGPINPDLEADFSRIKFFINEESGSNEFYHEYEEKLEINEMNRKLLMTPPMVTLFDGDDPNFDASFYHINMKEGKPEILLQKGSRYNMLGTFAHEYSHHTQALVAVHNLGLGANLNTDEEINFNGGRYRVLKEGQALRLEQMTADLLSEAESDINHYSRISKDILASMTKVYNVMNVRGKSKSIENDTTIFSFKPKPEPINDGDIGITYFMLANLNPEDFYTEYKERFL